MNYSKHCNLCDNEIASFEKGIICGITKKKPDFDKSCSNIELNEKFKEKLENVDLKFKELRKRKKSNYLTFFLLISFGFLLIIKSGTLAGLNKSETYFLVYKVGIIAVGITILMNAIKKLSAFIRRLKSTEFEKGKIDSVSKIYEINYKTELEKGN